VRLRRQAGLAALAAALLAAAGCRRGGEERAPAAVERRYEDGANVVVLRLDRERITAADSVHLEIEATAPEGTRIRLPAPGEELGKFRVAGVRPGAPELTEEGRVRLRTVYELEPFLAGTYEIPPLEVRFGENSIETGPLTVEVVSVLPEGAGKLDIKEIVPPVDLPGLPVWLGIPAAALILGGALWYWRRRKKRAEATEPAPEPHETALEALRALMAEDLLARGEAKLFYLRLSAILRHYIEDRFGLHAPERTTEEFLRDLRSESRFTEEQKRLLKEFLMHCDMVKFAGYRPGSEEVDRAVNTCAQFIAETRPRESEPEAAGVGA